MKIVDLSHDIYAIGAWQAAFKRLREDKATVTRIRVKRHDGPELLFDLRIVSVDGRKLPAVRK